MCRSLLTSRCRPAPRTTHSSSSPPRRPTRTELRSSLGPQEAAQVVQAAGQMASDLPLAVGFPHSRMTTLGDVADNIVMVSPFPPRPASTCPSTRPFEPIWLPPNDPELAPEKVEGFALRGWIGLYALLRMIRAAGVTEFSGEAITSMLQSARRPDARHLRR